MPKLLSGGNPQIAKGYGDEVVQSYIAAMPGWTRAVGRKVDALITAALPEVRKAVKWNSPLYGAPDGETWFASFHVFTRYVKIAFYDGRELDPVPPETSKSGRTRYLHVHEGEEIDEKQFTSWVEQAAGLPGEKM